MRRSTILVAVLLMTSVLAAQNWAPINATEKFHYSSAGQDTITHTLHVESTATIAGDSIYYLNRVVVNCDTCQYQNYGLSETECTSDSCLSQLNGNQFLMRRVQFNDAGIWHFLDPESFILNTNAQSGESWEYTDELISTVDSITESQVFGVLDSVKFISLSDGRSIVLSKNHGVLVWNDISEEYSLTGIEERGIGIRPPRFHDVFDFAVGDVFQYRESGYGSFGDAYKLYKKTVTDIEVSPDSATIYYDYVGMSHSNGNTYFQSYELSEMHTVSDYPEFDYDIDEYFECPFGYQNPSTRCQIILNEELGRSILSFGGHLGLGFFEFDVLSQTYGHLLYEISDSVWYHYPTISDFNNGFGWSVQNEAIAYGEGLGLKSSFVFSSLAWDFKWMVGYIKDDDTTGTITPDDVILSIEENLSTHHLAVFPNPAEDEINIAFPSDGVYDIRLFDARGRQMTSVKSVAGDRKSTIPCSNWENGLYFIEMRRDNELWVGRVVVH